MFPVIVDRCKTRCCTTYNEHYNALSVTDAQLRDYTQEAWAIAIVWAQHAQMQLGMMLLLDLDGEENDLLMMLIPWYELSRQFVLRIQEIDSLLMDVTPEQVFPRRGEQISKNRSFNLMDPQWCNIHFKGNIISKFFELDLLSKEWYLASFQE